MDRPAAMADGEAIRVRDGRADEGLGVAHRRFEIGALGEFGCDRRRQRAAGAVGVIGRDPRRRQRQRAAGADQIIDTLAALPAQGSRVTIRSCQVQPFATPVPSGYYGFC